MLPGLYETRPDLAALVQQEERFSVFFPLGAALARGIFSIAANETVPKAKQPFPVIRSQAPNGTVFYWDGNREWRETWWRRTPRWRRGALYEIWNDTLLVERIVTGWAPTDRS
jgi:hypothetical protein